MDEFSALVSVDCECMRPDSGASSARKGCFGAQAVDGLDPVLVNHLGAHGLFFVMEQHGVGPTHGTTPLGGEAGQDVLLEGVIGSALRRRAQRVAAPLVTAPSLAIPLFDGIRRVGQDHIELAQTVYGLTGAARRDFMAVHLSDSCAGD